MHVPTKEILDKLLALGDARFTSPLGKLAWGLVRSAIVANEARIIDEVDRLGHKLVDAITKAGDEFVAKTPNKIDDFVWQAFIRPFLRETVLELQAEG